MQKTHEAEGSLGRSTTSINHGLSRKGSNSKSPDCFLNYKSNTHSLLRMWKNTGKYKTPKSLVVFNPDTVILMYIF